jgi:exodeoxyribonuclease V alpha subunit
MSETIHGTVERVYFASPTFSAGVIDAGSGVKVKFSGKFHVSEGEPITIVGDWQKHPKYGYQFTATGLSHDLPETPEGLERYLARSKAFRGIGEATAEKLVEYAGSGERLDDLIRTGIDELRAALRIPVGTLETLREQWIAHATENKVRTYLSAFDLSPHQIDTLLTRFGEGIVSVLKDDPYMLIRHVRGYGFKRVDEIARKTGISKDHPGRVKAGLLHTVQEEIDSGHTWIDGGELIRKANDLLLLDGLDSLDRIKVAGRDLITSGNIVGENAAVSLPYIYEAEKTVADAFAMARMLPAVEPKPTVHIPADLNPGQRTAFCSALCERVSAISGGAGTGKTFIVGKLAQAWRDAGKNICLCAPTGKAAKRIEDVLRTKHGITDIEARTIHRVLGYDEHVFHTERIDADVIVIDEFSMVDVPLCAELFRRIDLSRTQIVLVGDHNQLPPVGPGNILRDIMAHDLVPNTVLDTVVRNAGPIERAAQQILAGNVPPQNSGEPEWAVVDSFKEPEAIRSYLRDLVLDMIPRHLGYDPVRDVQIVTPFHKGPLGTKSVNAMMQYLIHGDVRGRFVIGDKIIQTVNDYTLGVMNGHQGTVLDIDKNGVTVDFDGEGSKVIEQEKQGSLQLAYALTAHKAQGSEFPCVVVLCHKSHFFADRNWLYTAVTRAAKHVIVLGDRWGLRNAVKKNEVRTRRTLLSLWSNASTVTPAECAAAGK